MTKFIQQFIFGFLIGVILVAIFNITLFVMNFTYQLVVQGFAQYKVAQARKAQAQS